MSYPFKAGELNELTVSDPERLRRSLEASEARGRDLRTRVEVPRAVAAKDEGSVLHWRRQSDLWNGKWKVARQAWLDSIPRAKPKVWPSVDAEQLRRFEELQRCDAEFEKAEREWQSAREANDDAAMSHLYELLISLETKHQEFLTAFRRDFLS